jgi:hypothetical protein
MMKNNHSGMHGSRRLLVAAIVTAVILSALISCYHAQAAKTPLAMITGIYGPHMVKVIQDGREVDAEIRFKLFRNDTVQTGRNGRATILLKDRSEIKLGPGSEIVIKEEKEKRGLLVKLGKVFAKMTPQKSNFQIQSPYGAAAIEGTELQVEVAQGRSTVTVADGKVRFFNNSSKVMLAKSQQSSSTSITGKLTAPQQVQLFKLINWQGAIVKYYDAIGQFIDLYNQAKAMKAVSVGGSLADAKPLVDKMLEIEAIIGDMVPDDQMKMAHGKLLLAFALMRQSLWNTNAQQSAQAHDQAEQIMNGIVLPSLNTYKGQYDQVESSFLNSL